MSREKNTSMTDNQRAAIARGWASSGMDQAEYARLHRIRPRTLREWILRWAPTTPADVRALAIVRQTLRDLQALHDALAANVACQQAESQGEPQPTGGGHQLRTAPSRHADRRPPWTWGRSWPRHLPREKASNDEEATYWLDYVLLSWSASQRLNSDIVFAPFIWLHLGCAIWRLPYVSLPPRDLGWRWSRCA